MFEDQTFDTVINRMLSKFPTDMDTREGSVPWDMLAPSAIEFEQAYQQLDLVVNWFFTNADIPHDLLIDKCEDVGVFQKLAVAASEYATFTGPVGTVILLGTRLSTSGDEPIYFVTKEAATIPDLGTIKVLIEAEIAGTSGNQLANTITVLVDAIDGVTVTNEQDLTNGIDDETDESLYQRYKERVSTPSSSGNSADYIRWAKEVNGIGYVRVYRWWNGPGTVRLVLLTDQKKNPSPLLIESVRQNVLAKQPDLATVTVDGAIELSLDIDVTLTLTDGADSNIAIENVKQSIGSYLSKIAFEEQTVRYSKIGEAILDAEFVLDYENLRVNNGTSNILLKTMIK